MMVTPAEAGVRKFFKDWIMKIKLRFPAFAGMTKKGAGMTKENAGNLHAPRGAMQA
jgi:hypothetical protein